MKISGLDKLQKTMADAQKAISALEGDLGHVDFDVNDPASIEAALTSMESIVDERLGRYASNPIIAPMIPKLKDQFREMILAKAAERRLKAGGTANG